MNQLRIFSYLPNPRIWKATIAARLNGVELEVRGASPKELQSWLWDYEARPLKDDETDVANEVKGRAGFKGLLRKTAAFGEAHPFGTVPAAFGPDGKVGIFESNSIMRAVARLGEDKFPLYGRDAYEASRIDSFLDASLVFARDSQVYLLALGGEELSAETHRRTREAFHTYMSGINQALKAPRRFIVGESLSLADICFACELALFFNEKTRGRELSSWSLEPIVEPSLATSYHAAIRHFDELSSSPAFAPDFLPYLEKIQHISSTRK